ncbi:MAG: aminotransferase class I/II-fold pyridoxal phosphate-dependent enzyme [Promethearchaeota archaeon]
MTEVKQKISEKPTVKKRIGKFETFPASPRVKMSHLTKEMGLYPYFIPNTGKIGPRVHLRGKETIMLGSNNYLGLADHPEMIQAAKDAIEKYGTGCTGSRYLNGTLDLHLELENKLADFMGKDEALCYSTGMQANLGTISGITRKGDWVVSDEKNHASIIDGCRLSYANTKVFQHNDMEDLERVLRSLPEDGNRWIISDGVFSMEGNLAQIPRIIELADQYDARVIIDDAHGVGYLGDHGEGSLGHFKLIDRVDLVVGTFSKSFASIGGFVVGASDLIDYIRNHARALIYSASIPPASAATASKAIDLFIREEGLRKQVLINSALFRKAVEEKGFHTIPQKTPTPVVPIIIGDTMKTMRFNKDLIEAGVYTNPVVPPASTKAMLRTSLMATHTQRDIDEAVEILTEVALKDRVLKKKRKKA